MGSKHVSICRHLVCGEVVALLVPAADNVGEAGIPQPCPAHTSVSQHSTPASSQSSSSTNGPATTSHNSGREQQHDWRSRDASRMTASPSNGWGGMDGSQHPAAARMRVVCLRVEGVAPAGSHGPLLVDPCRTALSLQVWHSWCCTTWTAVLI